MRRNWSTPIMRAAACSALATGLLLPAAARAQQVVLFDVTYTHTAAEDATYTVRALEQPASWTAPIDYTQGTVFFHHEVFTKPSAAETLIDVCFDSMRSYGCLETQRYTTTGSFTTMRPMAPDPSWYQRDQVDFTRPLRGIQLILKDTAYNHGGRPQTDFLPSQMRFVMTLVPPGGTYRPPATSGRPPADAGAPPADASPADAPARETSEPTPPPVRMDAAVDRPTRPPPDAPRDGSVGWLDGGSAVADPELDASPAPTPDASAATDGSSSAGGAGGESASDGGGSGDSGPAGSGGSGGAMGPRPAPDTTIPGASSSRGCSAARASGSSSPALLWLAPALLVLRRLHRARRRRR